MRRFRQLTTGHPLIMGRKTYESIGRPLPGRTNIIVTRTSSYQQPGCLVAHDLKEALALAENHESDEVFVIGGGDLYAQTISFARKIYLTRVHTRLKADTFFPPIRLGEWLKREEQAFPASEKDQYPYTYQVLERLSGIK